MLSDKTSAILDRIRSHATGTAATRVQGLVPSARAAMISLLEPSPTGPWVVICPDEDSAQQLASDWETLTRVFPRPDSFGTRVAAVLPSWESSPLSSVAPSLRTRMERARVLYRLLKSPESIGCLFVTPQALLQRSVEPAAWAGAGLFWRIGEELDRTSVAMRLLDAGYQRVDTVEDPGTFALRGEIVDIFVPGENSPVRIELFDNTIERMRPFDPQSQKARPESESGINVLSVAPTREVLINRDTVKGIRERLKAYADAMEIPRSQRDPVLASVAENSYHERSDYWAAFTSSRPYTALDFIPKSSLTDRLVWVDALGALQNWDAELQRLRLDSERNPPPPIVPQISDLYSTQADGLDQLTAASVLFLDQVVLADPTAQVTGQDADEGSDNESRSILHVQTSTQSDLGPTQKHDLSHLEPKFSLWASQGFSVVIVCATDSQKEKVSFLLGQRDIRGVRLEIGSLSEGFRWPAQGWIVLTDAEVLGFRKGKQGARAKREASSAATEWAGLQELTDLVPGDAVVHVDHGIGRYQGLVRLDSGGGGISDFLQIEYANKDKLYLPVYRMGVIQKYVGSGEGVILDRLGSGAFARAKEKVRDAVKRMAFDLVEVYAKRQLATGPVFSGRDDLMREFEAKFPFEETPDQWKAIDATLEDLSSGRVMDRLVCGDVGYGKTEVAMRAAFRVASEGKQVALLVPTTVLATQHELSFRSRFAGWPIRIETLSRFKSAADQKTTLTLCREGKVDILIGTHRLLSQDVHFRDLGLVIVDEEHRFGVEHKEKLKALRVNSHVLTLSATPIPRTLHMALSGLREITLMTTPPVDRLPIRTYVAKHEDELVRRSIEFEIKRGGQVFYVHNRVQSIYECANRIRELAPGVNVTVAHGQLSEKELEAAMIAFYEKRAQVLICTSIIESGLDVPSANTLIVERADLFGLAQLYQIRGRVGRGQSRGYAYLLVPSEQAITEDSKKRLEVIQRFVELGSGFSVASHDLEIRGGGDLLGAQQSGHIASVGFDLYTELLDEAIREIQGKPQDPLHDHKEPEIKVPFPAFLSEAYVPDVHQRLSLYRKLSSSANDEALSRVESELEDRFGPLPQEAKNLSWLIRLKILLKRLGLEALTAGPEKVALVPGPRSTLRPERAIALLAANPNQFQLTPDSKIVITMRSHSLQELYLQLDALLNRLSQ